MAKATASTTGTSAVTMYTHREKFYKKFLRGRNIISNFSSS